MTIEELRARVLSLQTERASVGEQARSRAECGSYTEQRHVDHEAQGKRDRAQYLRSVASGEGTAPLVAYGTGGVRVDLGPLLTALFPERVRQFYAEGLQDVPEGLDREAKADRLADIAAELDRLEAQEERAIMRSERTAQPIARRADARPEIIFSVTDDSEGGHVD